MASIASWHTKRVSRFNVWRVFSLLNWHVTFILRELITCLRVCLSPPLLPKSILRPQSESLLVDSLCSGERMLLIGPCALVTYFNRYPEDPELFLEALPPLNPMKKNDQSEQCYDLSVIWRRWTNEIHSNNYRTCFSQHDSWCCKRRPE